MKQDIQIVQNSTNLNVYNVYLLVQEKWNLVDAKSTLETAFSDTTSMNINIEIAVYSKNIVIIPCYSFEDPGGNHHRAVPPGRRNHLRAGANRSLCYSLRRANRSLSGAK